MAQRNHLTKKLSDKNFFVIKFLVSYHEIQTTPPDILRHNCLARWHCLGLQRSGVSVCTGTLEAGCMRSLCLYRQQVRCECPPQLKQLADESQKKRSNVSLIVSKVGVDKQPKQVELWETIRKLPGLELPYVVVRTSVNDKQAVNSWYGPLAKFKPEQLLDSPARRELTKRLLKGDSVVWVVVKSSQADRNTQITKLLNDELKKLAKNVPFPEGLGLPGSELYSELPLLMQFTVLEIDPADEREQFLVGLFRGFEPDAVKSNQPLVVPVFGRGRALEVLPADRLDAGMIGDLTRYLCGACSCQVKERNPGFDLLLQADWDRELFGASGELPPPPKEFDPNSAPTYVPIPKR